MLVTLIVVGVLFLTWLAINFKTSRPDGDLLERVPHYRTMLMHIIPKRNSATVYYDTHVEVDKLLEYLEAVRPRFHCDITHAVVAACGLGLHFAPKMNRFANGFRLYQRRGNWITFSMKRKKKDEDAKLAAVKRRIKVGEETFKEMCESMATEIDVQRSGKKTKSDKEFDLLTAIPRPFLQMGTRIFMWMDSNNILPQALHDEMFTSIFVANLGSVKMNPGYHHLYDWGNCPLFMMVGQIEERPLAIDGEVVVKRVLPIRWTYDERIDDGLSSRRGIMAVNKVLEDPFKYLGCVAEDGKSDFKLGEVLIPEDELRVG